MVLGDALCAMNLAASVMVNGVCCCYQMHEQNARRKEQESIVRSAVRSEWRGRWGAPEEPERFVETKSGQEEPDDDDGVEPRLREEPRQQATRPSSNDDQDHHGHVEHWNHHQQQQQRLRQSNHVNVHIQERMLKQKRDELVRQYHEAFSTQLETQRREILRARRHVEMYNATVDFTTAKSTDDRGTTACDCSAAGDNNHHRVLPEPPTTRQSPTTTLRAAAVVAVPTKTGGRRGNDDDDDDGKDRRRRFPRLFAPLTGGVSFAPAFSSPSSPELFVLSEQQDQFVNHLRKPAVRSSSAGGSSIREFSSLLDGTEDSDDDDDDESMSTNERDRFGVGGDAVIDEGSLEEICIE